MKRMQRRFNSLIPRPARTLTPPPNAGSSSETASIPTPTSLDETAADIVASSTPDAETLPTTTDEQGSVADVVSEPADIQFVEENAGGGVGKSEVTSDAKGQQEQAIEKPTESQKEKEVEGEVAKQSGEVATDGQQEVADVADEKAGHGHEQAVEKSTDSRKGEESKGVVVKGNPDSANDEGTSDEQEVGHHFEKVHSDAIAKKGSSDTLQIVSPVVRLAAIPEDTDESLPPIVRLSDEGLPPIVCVSDDLPPIVRLSETDEDTHNLAIRVEREPEAPTNVNKRSSVGVEEIAQLVVPPPLPSPPSPMGDGQNRDGQNGEVDAPGEADQDEAIQINEDATAQSAEIRGPSLGSSIAVTTDTTERIDKAVSSDVVQHVEATKVLLIKEIRELCSKIEMIDRERSKLIKGEEKARRKLALQLIKLRAEERVLRTTLDICDSNLSIGSGSSSSSSSTSSSMFSDFGFTVQDSHQNKEITIEPFFRGPIKNEGNSLAPNFHVPLDTQEVPRNSADQEVHITDDTPVNQPGLRLRRTSTITRPVVIAASRPAVDLRRRVLPWSTDSTDSVNTTPTASARASFDHIEITATLASAGDSGVGGGHVHFNPYPRVWNPTAASLAAAATLSAANTLATAGIFRRAVSMDHHRRCPGAVTDSERARASKKWHRASTGAVDADRERRSMRVGKRRHWWTSLFKRD